MSKKTKPLRTKKAKIIPKIVLGNPFSYQWFVLCQKLCAFHENIGRQSESFNEP